MEPLQEGDKPRKDAEDKVIGRYVEWMLHQKSHAAAAPAIPLPLTPSWLRPDIPAQAS